MKDLAKTLHDLRAPLAKAKTLAKLMKEGEPEELQEQLPSLLKYLEELDQKIKELEREIT
jgi:hypothetical protein